MVNKRVEAREHKDLRRAAFHEAGHAFAAHRLESRIHKVTVKPTGLSRGRVYRTRGLRTAQLYGSVERTKMYLAREIKIAYAGALAVKIAFPGTRYRQGAENDYKDIGNLVLQVYEDERRQFLWTELLRLDAEAMLLREWFAVEAIANALIERTTLTGREVQEVIWHAKKAEFGARTARKGNQSGLLIVGSS